MLWEIEDTAGTITVTFDPGSLFVPGSAVLTEDAERSLRELGRLLEGLRERGIAVAGRAESGSEGRAARSLAEERCSLVAKLVREFPVRGSF